MNKFIACLLFFTLFTYACSEDGLQGPEGPQGEQGPVGEAGTDGSILHSGNGIPNISLGKNGDYYLNKLTGELYGPKVDNSWGQFISLRGKDGSNGTNGTNGSKILSGNDQPANTLGVIGDFYFDRANFLLFGPKTTTGWGTGILLRGAQGIQGPVGPAGADGSIIFGGNGLPAATIGKNGDYYLNKLNGDFYGPKVNNVWGTPISLKGRDGTNGTNGTNGNKILNGNGQPLPSLGAVDDYYLDKSNLWFYGPKTISGWGVGVLLRGAQGIQGPVGPAGADGSIIYSGSGAPAPQLGKNNDFYFDKTNFLMYGPKTTVGWGTGVSFKGSNGTNGTNGTNGVDGNTILNGIEIPTLSLGKIGDFYINIRTYEIYGPKTATSWGTPTSLRASGGGSEVIALEFGSNSEFIWHSEDFSVGSMNLKKHVLNNYNDSTSRFIIPSEYVEAVKTGSVQVYLGVLTSSGGITAGGSEPNSWVQLNFSNVYMNTVLLYTYSIRIVENTAYIRILLNKSNSGTTPFLDVKKVRIVIVPPTTRATVSQVLRNQNSLDLQMKALEISGKDFKKI